MKTINAFALALVPLAGCLATAGGAGVATDEPSDMEVVLITEEAAAPSLPALLTPAVAPAANRRLVHQVDVELGGLARANLRLCVDAAGGVTSATVARSSGIAAFDDVLVDAARAWRYEPLAARDAHECHVVTVSYRVR
jgi:TonB family protein